MQSSKNGKVISAACSDEKGYHVAEGLARALASQHHLLLSGVPKVHISVLCRGSVCEKNQDDAQLGKSAVQGGL